MQKPEEQAKRTAWILAMILFKIGKRLWMAFLRSFRGGNISAALRAAQKLTLRKKMAQAKAQTIRKKVELKKAVELKKDVELKAKAEIKEKVEFEKKIENEKKVENEKKIEIRTGVALDKSLRMGGPEPDLVKKEKDIRDSLVFFFQKIEKNRLQVYDSVEPTMKKRVAARLALKMEEERQLELKKEIEEKEEQKRQFRPAPANYGRAMRPWSNPY